MQGQVQGEGTKLLKALRIANFLNALILAAAGVFSFVLITTINPLTILAALYVIFFGLLLCTFECHLSRFDGLASRYFGFMFTWQGRVLFFLFVGMLAFGLGLVGIAAGIVTIVNVFFNIYVLTRAGPKAIVEQSQTELRDRNSSAAPAAAAAAKDTVSASGGAVGVTIGGDGASSTSGNPWSSV